MAVKKAESWQLSYLSQNNILRDWCIYNDENIFWYITWTHGPVIDTL